MEVRLSFLALLLVAHGVSAIEPDPLFQSDETLELVMHGPFASMMQERSPDTESTGTLSVLSADGAEQVFEVQFRTRGNFRRQAAICEFAPLRVNFQKSAVADSVFANQDKLKLVTHCEAREMRYKHAVVREYLAYRILNLFTDASFRVRMAKIRYVDTGGKRRDETEFAFFIESVERLGHRLGKPNHETDRVPLDQLDQQHLHLTSLFQYLIGNTDFSPIASRDTTNCCHNYRLFGDAESGFYSIPYDFDMAGIVNAPYAKPNTRFKLRSVTQRLYRGRCRNNEQLPTSIETFIAQRDAIEALVDTEAELSKNAKKTTRKFIDNFYKLVENPKRVEGRLVGDCV